MTATGEVTRSEILEQPEALARLLREQDDHVAQVAAAIRERAPRYVTLVARGSSDNAARYSQYLFATLNGLSAGLAIPSAYTIYRQPPRMTDSLVVAVSQSGQSPDIVAVVEEGRRQGALTVTLTNHPDSPLARAADHTIPLLAGAERAVAATKSYTTSLLALAMLSAHLAGDSTRLDELANVPQWVSAVTADAERTIRAAERYTYIEQCVVISRGFNYATAFEIALKLKEMSYIIAEPYSSADFLHGPVAVVDKGFPVFAVVPDGLMAEELTGFLRSLAERGADLIVAAARKDALSLAHTPLPLPAGIPEWLSPIAAVVHGQLFALGLTLAKGYDPDQPRGLRKVTLTM